MSRGTRSKQNEKDLIVVEVTGMPQGHLGCVGCGTTEGVKMLGIRTSYDNPQDTRQVIPACEMCSLNFGLQLFHIWNPGATGVN